MRTTTVLAALVTLWAGPTSARADDAPAPAPAPEHRPTALFGRVTSSLSMLPVAGASVFVATGEGLEQTAVTDDDGHYRVVLAHDTGSYNLIFAFGSSRNGRHFHACQSCGLRSCGAVPLRVTHAQA